MPLLKGKSKKAFSENVSREMHAGKPQKRALAIAYSVKRANSKKKMAYGGKIDEEMASYDHRNEQAGREDNRQHLVDSHPRDEMSPNQEINFHDENRLDIDNSMDSREMLMRKRMASGGPVEVDFVSEDLRDNEIDSARTPEDMHMIEGNPKGHDPYRDVYAGHDEDMERMEDLHGKKPGYAKGGNVMNPKLQQAHMEDGDMVDHVMRKRKAKMMAEGGMVDLSRNADEDPNMEDDMSWEALKKENYSETPGLNHLDQPMDSNEHGHMLPDEDEHDLVEQVRRKIKMKKMR